MIELFLKLTIDDDEYADVHPDLIVEDYIIRLADGCNIEAIELDGGYHSRED